MEAGNIPPHSRLHLCKPERWKVLELCQIAVGILNEVRRQVLTQILAEALFQGSLLRGLAEPDV